MTNPRSTDDLEVTHRGQTAIVRKNDGHPEGYLWIHVGPKQFFLGNLVPGMTRGAVKAMARRWLEERSGHDGRGA